MYGGNRAAVGFYGLAMQVFPSLAAARDYGVALMTESVATLRIDEEPFGFLAAIKKLTFRCPEQDHVPSREVVFSVRCPRTIHVKPSLPDMCDSPGHFRYTN